MKRERVNKYNINNTRVIIKDIKKGLCNTKEEYNLTINICKTIINKRASDNKKVLGIGNKRKKWELIKRTR